MREETGDDVFIVALSSTLARVASVASACNSLLTYVRSHLLQSWRVGLRYPLPSLDRPPGLARRKTNLSRSRCAGWRYLPALDGAAPGARSSKGWIIAESYQSGETVSAIARRYGLTPQQLFGWRRAAPGGTRG